MPPRKSKSVIVLIGCNYKFYRTWRVLALLYKVLAACVVTHRCVVSSYHSLLAL